VTDELEMLLAREGDRVRLQAPSVGVFSSSRCAGEVLATGERVGVLVALGRAFGLIVPEGGGGTVVTCPAESARAPVGFGDVLFEIATASTTGTRKTNQVARDENAAGLILRSPQSGRFYHRPSPADPAFVAVGATIEDGQPVGMIEVMKTFSHVPYRASGGLPKRAKVARMLAADGADVKPGEPLLEVEPA
jgi:biotin carboxyl carrier protein